MQACLWGARSTAIEVALKMAFRKYVSDHSSEIAAEAASKADAGEQESRELKLDVIGLQGGYHGDTLGAMDAVAPSPYNGMRQTPW